MPTSTSTSATRRVHGSVEPTTTPTVSSVNTSPKAPTSTRHSPRRPRRCRCSTQQPTPQNPQLDRTPSRDPQRTPTLPPTRQCCNDPLNPGNTPRGRSGPAANRPASQVSMGRRGDAYDNAIAESFFATLETELLDRTRLRHPQPGPLRRLRLHRRLLQPPTGGTQPSDTTHP